MSYVEEQRVASFVAVGGGSTEIDVLTSAAVHSQSYVAMEQTVLRAAYALVTTAVAADLTAPVIAIKRRPTYGSTTGEETIDTITIPDGTAAGKVMYVNFEPVQVQAGDQIVFEITTAATDSGSAAGAAVYGLRTSVDEEEEANESDKIASA